MLSESKVLATLPAQDMERGRRFWEDTIGLKVEREEVGGIFFSCGDGTEFSLYDTQGSASGSHTQVAFEVSDLESEVEDLKGRGVTFEEYDYPHLKTKNGIADLPNGKGSWFKDSEGNIIGVFQAN